jgi:hypothetical protein
MSPSRFNFAPVSASPSTMVRVASGWFIVNGAAYGIMLIAILITLALHPPPAIKWWAFITNILILIASAVGLAWTGMLIGRCKRLGGQIALGLLLLPIVIGLLFPPLDTTALVFGVIGIAVLISVRDELTH